jgi:hypothetical protein
MFKGDLVLITAMTIAVILLNILRRPSFEVAIWLLLLIISLFPFFSFRPGDVGHRFFMIAPIVLIVSLSFLVKKISISIAAIFILLSVFSFKSYKPWAFDAPNAVYFTITDRLTDHYDPSAYPLVIAHKGLAEVIIYKTDFDALNWHPPDDIPTDSVLRISRNVLNADYHAYLDEEDRQQVKSLAPRYYAIPEATWQKFIKAAKAGNKRAVMRRIFGGSNPMEPRPYFIGKGKKH